MLNKKYLFIEWKKSKYIANGLMEKMKSKDITLIIGNGEIDDLNIK